MVHYLWKNRGTEKNVISSMEEQKYSKKVTSSLEEQKYNEHYVIFGRIDLPRKILRYLWKNRYSGHHYDILEEQN